MEALFSSWMKEMEASPKKQLKQSGIGGWVNASPRTKTKSDADV